MKKVLCLLLVLVLIFSLCGCEEKTADTTETITATATAQAETESEELTENVVATEKTPIIEEETEITASPIVYRTKTGEKYHRESCIHLKSKIETTVDEALSMGLGPCSVCQPPQ